MLGITEQMFLGLCLKDTIEELDNESEQTEKDYKAYYAKVKKRNEIIPNVEGMSGMDAISILENLGVRVKVEGDGIGKVKSQSIKSGQKIESNQTIVLQLS